jgi:hypothetical protein
MLAREGEADGATARGDPGGDVVGYPNEEFPANTVKADRETDRMGGGSRAQHDIIEFTLLRACIETGRHDELHRVLTAHRAGPGPIPVAGLH